MGILIGADFVPTKTNEEYFVNADSEFLFGSELNQILKNADYKIFNLEVPLTEYDMPILKCGPNLIAKPDTINLYKKMNVDLLTIANNHILDQGKQGLESTINILNVNDIKYVGAGNNLKEASKTISFKYKDSKVGVYACVEHEFSIATEDEGGANPFDPLNSFDDVFELSKETDFVIVLYHGGKEHYRYPSPDLQKICRKFIDKGADLIICQHSHCIGCKEEYGKGTIVYGQGNFLFDHSESEFWKTSLLVEVDDRKNINYIPIVKVENKVRLANETEKMSILEDFKKRSHDIQKNNFIEENYKNFANDMIDEYLWRISGADKSILLRVINRISGYKFYKKYIRKKYNVEDRITLLNYIECEAHREVLINALSRE